MQAEEEVSRSEEDEAASGNEAADVDAVDGGAAAAPSPEGVAADGDAAGAVDVAAGDAHGVADGALVLLQLLLCLALPLSTVVGQLCP